MLDNIVVPQFIDVEDKIIGPITTRQFIMGVITVFFIFLAYKFADLALFIIEAIIILGLYILLAFVKINGQKFHIFALSVIESLSVDQLRVWKKTYVKKTKSSEQDDEEEEQKRRTEAAIAAKPKARSQELSALSLMVDTGGKYRPEKVLNKKKNK